MAVFDYRPDKTIKYVKRDEIFALPLSEETVEEIINLWKQYKGGRLFNSACLRLADVETEDGTTTLSLEKTDFFSLLIANIISSQMGGFRDYVKKNCPEDKEKYLSELQDYYDSLPETDGFENLIRKGNLPNALAVSVLLMDKSGNVLLAKRTSNVVIGQNLYSVTATGAVDDSDWDAEDPLKSCASRELKEELNIDIPEDNIELVNIVAGVNKKQPIAILNAYLDERLDLNNMNSENASDYQLEVDSTYICGTEDLPKILAAQKFTEAAEYHLTSVIKDV